MRCHRCGFLNVDAARFCNKCGIALQLRPPQSQQNRSNTWKWVVGLLAGFCVLSGIMKSIDSTNRVPPGNQSQQPPVSEKKPDPPPKPAPEIHPIVQFTGTQFIIKNDDSFDWSNVKLELNGGIFSGGYELKPAAIRRKTTYTVGALQFADSDGTDSIPSR